MSAGIKVTKKADKGPQRVKRVEHYRQLAEKRRCLWCGGKLKANDLHPTCTRRDNWRDRYKD